MNRMFGVVVLSGVVAATAAGQDGAIKYKEYASKVGDKVRSVKEENSTTKTSADLKGKKTVKVEKKAKTVVVVTETLKTADAGERAKTSRRVYEKAEETTDGKTTKLPLDGKTVLIERTGEKYAFAYDDGTEVTGAAAKELATEFTKKTDFEKDVIPDRPLKAGDTWDFTDRVAALFSGPDSPFVTVKGKVTGAGKLVKAYTKGGKQYGVFELRGDIPIAELRGVPGKMNAGSAMTVVMEGDGCFDGTVPDNTSTGTITLVVDGEVNGVELKITADSVIKTKTELIRKK